MCEKDFYNKMQLKRQIYLIIIDTLLNSKA